MLLAPLFRSFVKSGRLTVTDPSGRRQDFGTPHPDLPPAHMVVRTRRAERALLLKPQLTLGECYMRGELTLAEGDIADLLRLIAVNLGRGYGPPVFEALARLRRWTRTVQQYNPVGRAQKNVSHHYDLSRRLYETFLDPDMQYSCAYFGRPDDTLEAAQAKKKRHIAAKLALEPGMRVLDIGSGWGGLGLYLARECGVEVVGVTLSREQCELARERVAAAGLSGRVDIRLQDYRTLTDRFDRVVSVGMFEHVGVGHYQEYFDKLHALLEPDGAALIHFITRSDGPGHTNLFIRKYIFPGGYTPALSEVLPPIERSGLILSDLEILRLHYAETLKAWRERFLAHREEVVRLYDEAFLRMWEFYLAGAEMGFRHQGLVVSQIQLARSIDALPVVRDYMVDWERGHAVPRPLAPAHAA
ncbi:MAG: class I SAM-dependent methyltransferase [Alphaproteobacteria bacterium]|nr:class I SAM-dependent methyltransferase [Alphaproteobacteria bacterium]